MRPSNPFRLTWLLCLALVRGGYGLIVIAITVLISVLAALPLLAVAVSAYFWIWHGNRDWALYTYIALFFFSGPYMLVWQAMAGVQGPPEPDARSSGDAKGGVLGVLGALGAMAARSTRSPAHLRRPTPEPEPEKPRVPAYRGDGRIICTNGELRDRHTGNFVGRIDANGRVTDGDGNYVGRMMSDGCIRS